MSKDRRGICMLTTLIYRNFKGSYTEQMLEVYRSVGWNKHSKERIIQVFEASNVRSIMLVDDKVVGFARAISDGVFNAAIYDLVVHKSYQHKGLATKILRDILIQLEPISCVHLLSTLGNEEFYLKNGFRKMKTGMARYNNPELAELYLL